MCVRTIFGVFDNLIETQKWKTAKRPQEFVVFCKLNVSVCTHISGLFCGTQFFVGPINTENRLLKADEQIQTEKSKTVGFRNLLNKLANKNTVFLRRYIFS